MKFLWKQKSRLFNVNYIYLMNKSEEKKSYFTKNYTINSVTYPSTPRVDVEPLTGDRNAWIFFSISMMESFKHNIFILQYIPQLCQSNSAHQIHVPVLGTNCTWTVVPSE